ncbi:MAG TPA: SH3 domain-containing protein [Anaerolineae bacterium]|nr:SH3 domain-containing protein [Anaerolineae bacterium]
MRLHVGRAGTNCLLLLGLLIGPLLFGFGSTQATQADLAWSSGQPSATATPAPQCTVSELLDPPTLRLRSGPGGNYSIITRLPRGTQLKPLAASPDRSWIQVVKIGGGATGWVFAAFVTCNVQPSQLPLGVVPPVPIVPSITPSPTPDSISFSPAPNQNGNPDGLDGTILVDQAALARGAEEPVFRDRLSIQMDVRDPDVARGTGIKFVEFAIRDDDNGDEYYYHRDDSAPYCLFINQGSTCDNTWRFQQTGNRWPNSSHPVAEGWNGRIDPNTVYRANIRAVSEDEEKEGEWNFTFRIIPTNTPSYAVYTVLHGVSCNRGCFDEVRAQYDSVVDNSGAVTFGDHMSFQLGVSDLTDDRIAEVQFEIRERDSGKVVYRHTERTPPFCVFANDDPNYCNKIWRFSETNYQWPPSDDRSIGAQSLVRGEIYEAFMFARDTNGDNAGAWDFEFDVR